MAGSTNKDDNTEERIKEAARVVFTQKGYAATRTRDIAEEAGINLALLNYYFRSKERLFEIVMAENVAKLFGILRPIINNPDTSLETKVADIANTYINTLIQNPGLPIFVLSEIRNNPEHFGNSLDARTIIKGSVLVEQLMEVRQDIHPLHFILNLLSMCIFPFIAQPVLEAAQILTKPEMAQLIEDRKKLITVWFKAMIEA